MIFLYIALSGLTAFGVQVAFHEYSRKHSANELDNFGANMLSQFRAMAEKREKEYWQKYEEVALRLRKIEEIKGLSN